MIRAVVKDDAEVDHGAARQVPPRGCVDDPFLDGRNEVLGNGPAEDVVHKLEARPARQGFQLDLAVAVLAVPAGLLLVLALRVGLAADRLPVGHLGGL